MIDEPVADRAADRLAGISARKLLPEGSSDRPDKLLLVRPDDTVLEVAALMARLRCPLVVVADEEWIVVAITAYPLLELAL